MNGQDFWKNVRIAWSLCLKSLEGRYARSAIGPLWLVLTPLSMLLLYWGVFSLVLGVKWSPKPNGEPLNYVVPFMAGLAIYLYLAEVITKSLNIFVSRRNYVRKSPLPLWVLWLSAFMAATITGAVNLALLVALLAVHGMLTITGFIAALPVIVVIVTLFGALSLFLALIGPFAGDVANTVGVIMRVLFYTAPVSFPLTLVPASVAPYLWLNPLTPLIELLRSTLVFGQFPPALPFLATASVALGLALLALWLNQRVAHAVRDVV